MAEVELPNGDILEVPDDWGPDQIKGAISKIGAPKYDPTEGMSAAEKVLAGIGQGMYSVGRGIGQRLGLVSQEEIDEAAKIDKALLNSGAGATGSVIGKTVSMLPAAAIPGGQTWAGSALIGAGMGALEPTQTGESVAQNMVMGAGGGLAGKALASGISRAIRPVQSKLSPEMQRLADLAENEYGIKLNAAQKTGSKPLKWIDSALDDLPFTSDRNLALKEAQRQQFNRAVLKTIGKDADVATQDVLGSARARIGRQFKDVSSRNSVKFDDQFLDDLINVESQVNEFSSPSIKRALNKAIETASKGNVPGSEYQKIRSTLTKASKDAYKSNSDLGGALKEIRNAFDNAARRSISPEDAATWDIARRQWANMRAIEPAFTPTSADAVAGNISPAKLASAMTRANKEGFIYGVPGLLDRDLDNLARIGQGFVKESLPNSGTAQRTLYQKLLESPFVALQSGIGGISLPVQALINSPAGQAYFSRGLLGGAQINPTVSGLLRQSAINAGAALPYALEQ
jgi:hypothetical protein